MNTILQWLLLAVAVGIGWALGRWRLRRQASPAPIDDEDRLRERLQFLFTNYSDEAIESFLDSLEVNRETVNLHLSIGAHFRDRGEVERATLIHQNLLARPELPGRYSSQVTYELALDYLAAGLLDRAEALLHELLGTRSYGARAAEQLVLIYQRERDWEKAVEVARTLVGISDTREIRKQLAHLLCEQASDQGAVSRVPDPRELLEQALAHDSGCVRASLLLADLARERGNWREAQQLLFKVFDQNPAFGPEAVRRLVSLAREFGVERKLRRRLHRIYRDHPSTTLLLCLAEEEERFNSRDHALYLLHGELQQRPSLRALMHLLEMEEGQEPRKGTTPNLVRQVGQRLLENRPAYQCIRCGFGGQQLHWLCPSCKNWETVEPYQGVEGE
ncbi:lipopolysaccharide assembly protein LapB [Vreelandella utahensis]|uniref:lipopolysaccharide assembly protein LapB n=1 Tax=Vreelandella halophila TaxID=86177 RepID=UPI0009842C08|nr:lipopolysaccharide assembly protein LapB [Halomonas utahensis]